MDIAAVAAAASSAWAVPLEIPSPTTGVWHLGPLPIRAYAMCILAGIVVAVWIAQRRLTARGDERGAVLDIAAWAVPFLSLIHI